MSKTYPFFAADGKSDVLDATVDTTYSTRTNTNYNMDKNLETAVLTLAAYGSDGKLATPTGGTFTVAFVSRKDYGEVKQELSAGVGDMTIDATEVIDGLATYNVPAGLGKTLEARITTSGVTGTPTFRAEVEKY